MTSTPDPRQRPRPEAVRAMFVLSDGNTTLLRVETLHAWPAPGQTPEEAAVAATIAQLLARYPGAAADRSLRHQLDAIARGDS